jgi:hypothetical protein
MRLVAVARIQLLLLEPFACPPRLHPSQPSLSSPWRQFPITLTQTLWDFTPIMYFTSPRLMTPARTRIATSHYGSTTACVDGHGCGFCNQVQAGSIIVTPFIIMFFDKTEETSKVVHASIQIPTSCPRLESWYWRLFVISLSVVFSKVNFKIMHRLCRSVALPALLCPFTIRALGPLCRSTLFAVASNGGLLYPASFFRAAAPMHRRGNIRVLERACRSVVTAASNWRQQQTHSFAAEPAARQRQR